MNTRSTRSVDLFAAEAAVAEITTSAAITLVGNFIFARDNAARADEPSHKAINLDRYWLPATPYTGVPIPLSQRPDIYKPLVNCLVALSASTGPNKSAKTRFTSAFNSMVKFVEYGWLNGMYSLSDWTPSEAEKLLKMLGHGGWTAALNIEARARVLLDNADREMLKELIASSHAKELGFSLRRAVNSHLGTSANAQELFPMKQMIMEALGLKAKGDTSPRLRLLSHKVGMGETHLRQEMSQINLLGERLPADVGLTFIPFEDTVKLSKKYGREVKRTTNLEPDSVAALLKTSCRWIYDLSEPVLRLLDELYSKLSLTPRADSKIDSKTAFKTMNACTAKVELEKALGKSIETVGLRHDERLSLKRVIYSLASACFIVIAFMNARRKDELRHPKYGLHRSAFRVVNADLALYECEFYIEKTYQDYETFYVGEMTKKAIMVLERLSDLARQYDSLNNLNVQRKLDRECKLFQLPRIMKGNAHGGGMQWFDFITTKKGLSRDLVEEALGKDAALRVHAHMFRRAYALIFHYRFENADLLALAQQLGHLDVSTVQIYVTDGPRGVKTATAASYARKGKDPRMAHIDGCHEEIRVVGVDRVLILAREVIAGGRESLGGFAGMVRRFHQRFARRLDYQQLDAERQAQKLATVFTDQGHRFQPKSHVNCVKSTTKRDKKAGCFSKALDRPAPENADASTCANCAYSHFVKEHMVMWKKDLEVLGEQADADSSLSARRAHIQLENLKRVIHLHEKRMQSSEPNLK